MGLARHARSANLIGALAALAAVALTLAGKQALALPAEVAPPTAAPEPPELDLPGEPEPPAPLELLDDVRYRADTIRYDTQSRVVKLEGHVVIERGKGRLYAPRGTVDRAAGKLRLEGGVLAIEGLQVALADAAVMDTGSRAADLIHATMFIKDRTVGLGLNSLTDPAAARTTGKNTLVLHGTRVRRLADGGYLAEQVTLTPCDCAGPPDYEVRSPEVEIHGDRALLHWPQLRIFELPVPIGIPISLPLTERQSGLLAPRFGFALATGFGIVEPVFLTLGRSFDVTLAPGFYTGASRAPPPADETLAPNYAAAIGARTVRGPRLDTELRAAPVAGTTFTLSANLIQDVDQDESKATGANSFGVPGSRAGRGFGGLRGVFRATERTEAAWGVAALEGTIASDAMVLADTQPGVLERVLDALRTDAGIWRARDSTTLGLDATLLQDQRVPDSGNPDRRLFGDEARRTFQRLPALFAQLSPTPFFGPILASGELSAVRFQPLRAGDPQEAMTGFAATDQAAGAAPAVAVQDSSGLARASVVRLDFAPRLSANLVRGTLGAVSASIGGRADAWLFDGDPARDHRRVYGLAAVRAETELSRSFDTTLHTVAPAIELRGITPSLASKSAPIGDPSDAGGTLYAAAADRAQQGTPPGQPSRDGAAGLTMGVPGARRPYDDLDGAAPSGGAAQAVLRVDQALWRASTPGRAPIRVAELTVAQDLLLYSGDGGGTRVGETWGAAGARVGPVSASVRAQFDWALKAFSGVQAGASAGDARGDLVRFSILALRQVPSELLRAGADELFSSVRLLRDPGSGLLGVASAGLLARLPIDRPPLALGYGIDRTLQSVPVGYPDTTHHFSAQVETTCRCAGVQLGLDLPFAGGHPQTATVRFVLDLKSLGAFGTP